MGGRDLVRLSAAAREFRWRDSADLRELAADVSADPRFDFSEQKSIFRSLCQVDQLGRTYFIYVNLCDADHLFRFLLCRHHF